MSPKDNAKHANEGEIVIPKDRSVADYDNAAELTHALKEVDLCGQQDWALHNFDKATTVEDPNNIRNEVYRLLCLKSYGILDSNQETEFESITNECQRLFQCPIAVVSLVDLGRQWFKSIQGLPVESTPRCLAFCAHVVKRKEKCGVMVVPDATKDPRFKDNALVAGGPKIRFYAGAPLITPEGHRIGSLCVIDYEPHPEGLSWEEEDQLQVLAQEVVFYMIARTED